MEWYQIDIKALTAFATPLKGDTLFGQLCWTIRDQLGNEALEQLLEGYTQGAPFLVVSDPMPSGYIKKPFVPGHIMGLDRLDSGTRKQIKKTGWLPTSILKQPISQWRNDILLATKKEIQPIHGELRHHNTINRITNATGLNQFAPFSSDVINYEQAAIQTIYLLSDGRLTAKKLEELILHIGLFGYGKEATTGLGKFEIANFAPCRRPGLDAGSSAITLAPSVVEHEQLKCAHCYYQPFTRFGRHGAALATGQQPFKNPTIMVDSGALLTFTEKSNKQFVGKGLGGDGQLSHTMPKTVQQGYSPIALIES